MKAKFLFGAGLLMSGLCYGQNTTVPSTPGGYGTNNVFVGHMAGDNNSNIGSFNVFTGYQAGLNNSIGHSNVFSGSEAGFLNKGGYSNIFTGYQAGYTNTSGSGNVFIGDASGRLNQEGGEHCFIGYRAGATNVNSHGNVFAGYESGVQNATGNYNVFSGFQSGRNNNGSANVFIGSQSGMNETGSNKLFIANSPTPNPLVYGDFSAKELKFNANRVGIGSDFGSFPLMTTIPNASSYRLFVRGGILAEEVRIRLQADWADYVFLKDYKLLSLADTEQYINENGHLPNMPSAAQVKEEGIEMGNIIKLQQEKIEELTLHLIEQDKKMEELKAQVQLLLNK